MACPPINSTATNDIAIRGSTYKKSYGVTDLVLCNQLTPPLTWAIVHGPPGTLTDNHMSCALVGTLTFAVPIGTVINTVYHWTISLKDKNDCYYETSWTTTVKGCRVINDIAKDDKVVGGTTYRKLYGLTNWNGLPLLVPPLTWAIILGPLGATLSDPNLCCGNIGTLTYVVPKGAAIINWKMSLTDANGCYYEILWKTTIICPVIKNNAQDDTVVAGTVYTRQYYLTSLQGCLLLATPLSWILTGPTGASLDKPTMDCATNDILNAGTLTYQVPLDPRDVDGTLLSSINWEILLVDATGCQYYATWTTNITRNPTSPGLNCICPVPDKIGVL